MRRRTTTPVGDILVSYEASEMPTETLARLSEERFAQIEGLHKASEIRQHCLVLGWLLRIAIHKLKALEAG